MTVLNLEDELLFYKQYHYNHTNVAIHMVFIPMILFTYILAFNYLTIPFDYAVTILDSWFGIHDLKTIEKIAPYLNLGSLLAVGYSLFYCLLDYFGFLVTPLIVFVAIYGKYYTMTYLETSYSITQILSAIMFVNTVSWIFQFIGHGVFEKRKPALLDSLVQALVLAPFFVVFEIAFFFGFRKDLEVNLERRVKVILKDLKKLN